MLLAGPSGSGKSTLLRALAGVLTGNENGRYAGSVTRAGGPDATGGPAALGGPPVGLLLQDSTDAVVARRAGRDAAFGLENQGVPRERMWQRVRAALQGVRFPYGQDHLVAELSGGERQRLALAGVVVLQPGLLLLDEPTSMLDPDAAAAVRQVIVGAAAAAGATTVVVEHHLDPWVGWADRLLVLDRQGALAADGPCEATLREHGAVLAAHGVWVPGAAPPVPVTVGTDLVRPEADGPVSLEAHAVGLRLGDRWALREVDARLASGRALAVQGASGAGKSSLVSVLAGLVRPSAGEVVADPRLRRGLDRSPYRWRSTDLARRVGWVPQQPEHAVVRHTVRDDLRATGLALGQPAARVAARAEDLAECLGLAPLLDANPYTLSGGEQRRLSLATALAHGPDLLLLDEPTVGQDRGTWAAVVGVVAAARAAGCAVALATHDRLCADAVADARLTLDAGRVVLPAVPDVRAAV